jgi:hypothetical protein
MIFIARLNNPCVFIGYLDDQWGTLVTGIMATGKLSTFAKVYISMEINLVVVLSVR